MMEMNLQFFGGRGSSGGKRSGGGGGGSSESYSESKLNRSDYRGDFYSMPMGSKVVIENSAAGGRWDGVYTKVQQGNNGWALVNSSGEKIFGHSDTGTVTNAMSAVLKKSSVRITVKRKRV